MAVTNYYSIGGEIVGERTAGATRIDYLTDALGSVTSTVNQSAQVANTYRFKPYGSQLAKTGSAPDPKFTWVGTEGYRQTGNQYSESYVLVRHYAETLGQWNTIDPIGADGRDWNLYRYVSSSPSQWMDSSGLTRDDNLAKCKRLTPAACFECAEFEFVGNGSDGKRLGNYLSCIRANAFCHSHIICEKFFVNNPVPAPFVLPSNTCGTNPLIPIIGMIGTYPYGTILNPEGDCIAACLAEAGQAGGGAITAWMRQVCKLMCQKIQAAGCEGLYKYCERFVGEQFRDKLCFSVWKGAGCV